MNPILQCFHHPLIFLSHEHSQSHQDLCHLWELGNKGVWSVMWKRKGQITLLFSVPGEIVTLLL